MTFGYERSTAVVRDLNLTVEDGSVVGLVGPSGSGKTTLLALAGGLLRPNTGEVAVTTRSEHGHSRSGGIGWVLQNTRSLVGRSALDNVAVALLAQGWRRPDAVSLAEDRLEEVGLGDLVGQRVERLSGGQQQRVCIARAMANDPALVLADEPTGQLDQATSLAIISVLLTQARSRGAALVIATHDDEVAGACDTVIRL